tara:strand:- start:420 stop:1196 length:777 start_codon:yes stop_codon:yes gene_type:complete
MDYANFINYNNDTNDIYGFQNMSNNISYEYIIDNIDNNVQRATCKEEIPSIEHAMNIRNSIINILNDNDLDSDKTKSNINASGVIIEEKKEDNVKKCSDMFDEFIKDYKKKQEHYLECKNKFQDEINRSKNNIKKLDLIIQFIRELDKDCNDQETEELLNSLKILSNKIENDKNIITARTEYIKSRKDIENNLNLVKKINSMNMSNTCPLCLTNQVNIYLNPCGHTCCEECYGRLSNTENKCFLCRSNIMSKNPLYFS